MSTDSVGCFMFKLVSRIVSVLAICGCIAACAAGSTTTSSRSSATSTSASSDAGTAPAGTGTVLGYEGMPIERGPALAPAGTTGTGTVDGITCAPLEQLAYHIHAHLAVYVDGSLRSLPAGIGIPGSQPIPYHGGVVAVDGRCIYWLHTHTNDGVIHIESPTERVYPLGDFFDEWHQPLSSRDVAGVRGAVTAIVNGKPWKASPRAIPLLPHEDIQLDIGSPAVPFQSVSWSQSSL